MSLALCLLAAAIWLSGTRRSTSGRGLPDLAGPIGPAVPRSRVPALRSRRALQVVAALGVLAAAIAVLGSGVGAMVGLVASPVAALAAGRLADRAPPRGRAAELAQAPLVLDLVAAVLASGQPVDAALAAAAPSAGPWLRGELLRVAGLLRLGADPTDAWRHLASEPMLVPVTRAAIRCADSGIRLAASFAELAQELRAESRASAQARAQRVGVWAIAPLGLCFLPAFVCLGIAPTVVGIGKTLIVGGL